MDEPAEGLSQGTSLMEHFSRLGKESSAYLFGSAANRIVAIVLIPMYTRYLTPHDYGIFALVTATIGYVSVLMRLGLSGAYLRFYLETEDREERKGILNSSFFFGLFWSVALSVPFLLASRGLSAALLKDGGLYILFLLAFGGAVFDCNAGIPLSRFRARGEPRRYVAYTLARFIVGVSLNILFVAVLGRGLRGIFEAGLISSMAIFLFLLPTMRTELRPSLSLSRLSGMLGYAVPLVPASLAAATIFYADRLLLELFRTAEVVGLYNLGYSIGVGVNMVLVSPFSLAWGPIAFAAYRHRDSALRLYSRALTYYALLGAFICLAFLLFARPVLVLLATPGFYGASQIVPFIAVSYFFSGAVAILGTGLRIAKRTKYMALAHILAAVLNLVANLILIPPFGMVGAAGASVLSYVFLAIIVSLSSSRFLQVRYETGRLLRILLAAVAVALIGSQVQLSSVILEALAKFAVLGAYPLVLFAVSFFTEDEMNQLRRYSRSPIEFVRLMRP